MNISKVIFSLILLTLPLGQLTRMELAPNVVVYLNDLLIPILILVWVINAGAVRKKIFLPPYSGRIFIFIMLALLSLLVGSFKLSGNEMLVSGLFLVRFIQYASLYFIGFDLFKDDKFKILTMKTLIFSGFLVAVLGFLQFVIIPDFAEMASQGGWDPHQYRLLSTFFDPNFVGGYLVLVSSYIISYFFFKPKLTELVALTIFGLAISVAIMLTFSRSTYLAFFTMLTTFATLKSRKIFLPIICVMAAFFILIPAVQNRLVQAINLDDSARARLISWQNAVTIAKDNPTLGVGFNSYRFAQERYGFLKDFDGGGHSGSGSDSSLLLILATTGIVGFISFLTILIGFFKYSLRHQKEKLSLAFLVGFVSLIVHSQFVNSLFYPQIMEVFWVGGALMVAIPKKQSQNG